METKRGIFTLVFEALALVGMLPFVVSSLLMSPIVLFENYKLFVRMRPDFHPVDVGLPPCCNCSKSKSGGNNYIKAYDSLRIPLRPCLRGI